jgi:hypothetical protein
VDRVATGTSDRNAIIGASPLDDRGGFRTAALSVQGGDKSPFRNSGEDGDDDDRTSGGENVPRTEHGVVEVG